jgi:hypothetical protein
MWPGVLSFLQSSIARLMYSPERIILEDKMAAPFGLWNRNEVAVFPLDYEFEVEPGPR